MEVHRSYNQSKSACPVNQIKIRDMKELIKYFKAATDKNQVPLVDFEELRKVLVTFEEDFCVHEDEELDSIVKVQSNDLFKTILKDILSSLKAKAESDKKIVPYLDEQSLQFRRLRDKLSCLILNTTIDYFGLTDEDMETNLHESAPEEELAVADVIGEKFEDMDLDIETVDQMKQLYLLLDLKRVPDFKNDYS